MFSAGTWWTCAGIPHPPLDGWVLAGLIAVFGDVKEVPFHAAYTVFSLIAAASMWSLAQQLLAASAMGHAAVPGSPGVRGERQLFRNRRAVSRLLDGWQSRSSVRQTLESRRIAMVLATLTAYQAILLSPILAVYLLAESSREPEALAGAAGSPRHHRGVADFRTRSPPARMPAEVLTGYLTFYETLQAKLQNALMLFIHSWFIVFPALLPPAVVLAWRKRREPRYAISAGLDRHLLRLSVVALAFAGSARYLLPMAAPVALLASQLRPKWLAAGFALQMALSLGLAAMNHQHWDAYRDFAASLRRVAGSHRVWVDDEWGLRFYIERDGGPCRSHTNNSCAPAISWYRANWATRRDSRAGHADHANSGDPPFDPAAAHRPGDAFGLLHGLARLLAVWRFHRRGRSRPRLQIGERHPTLEYLTMDAPEAAEQIVSGIWPRPLDVAQRRGGAAQSSRAARRSVRRILYPG